MVFVHSLFVRRECCRLNRSFRSQMRRPSRWRPDSFHRQRLDGQRRRERQRSVGDAQLRVGSDQARDPPRLPPRHHFRQATRT